VAFQCRVFIENWLWVSPGCGLFFHSLWQTLGVPSALTPIGQLHQETVTKVCLRRSQIGGWEAAHLLLLYDDCPVPGLPIRNCAGISNNLVPRGFKVSAINVMAKEFDLWAFIFGFKFRIGHIWAPRQLSLCTYNPDRSLTNYFSISVQFFSPNGPPIFFCMIHQVICPCGTWYNSRFQNLFVKYNWLDIDGLRCFPDHPPSGHGMCAKHGVQHTTISETM